MDEKNFMDKNFMITDKVNDANANVEQALGLAQALSDELNELLNGIIDVDNYHKLSPELLAYEVYANRYALTALSTSLLQSLRSAHESLK